MNSKIFRIIFVLDVSKDVSKTTPKPQTSN